MPARQPEECDSHLVAAINRGDLEEALALYEPNATLVHDRSGEAVAGHAQIREILRGYMAQRITMTIVEANVLQNGDGDLALTGIQWKSTGTTADGKPFAASGSSKEVVRRQEDGTWRFVIDHPWGAGAE